MNYFERPSQAPRREASELLTKAANGDDRVSADVEPNDKTLKPAVSASHELSVIGNEQETVISAAEWQVFVPGSNNRHQKDNTYQFQCWITSLTHPWHTSYPAFGQFMKYYFTGPWICDHPLFRLRDWYIQIYYFAQNILFEWFSDLYEYYAVSYEYDAF